MTDLVDPALCKHENLVDHPEPKWMYGYTRKGVPRLVPYSRWVSTKVMRCVDCGLPGEVPK